MPVRSPSSPNDTVFSPAFDFPFQLFLVLLRRWKTIFFFSTAGFLLGVLVALLAPIKYKQSLIVDTEAGPRIVDNLSYANIKGLPYTVYIVNSIRPFANPLSVQQDLYNLIPNQVPKRYFSTGLLKVNDAENSSSVALTAEVPEKYRSKLRDWLSQVESKYRADMVSNATLAASLPSLPSWTKINDVLVVYPKYTSILATYTLLGFLGGFCLLLFLESSSQRVYRNHDISIIFGKEPIVQLPPLPWSSTYCETAIINLSTLLDRSLSWEVYSVSTRNDYSATICARLRNAAPDLRLVQRSNLFSHPLCWGPDPIQFGVILLVEPCSNTAFELSLASRFIAESPCVASSLLLSVGNFGLARLP